MPLSFVWMALSLIDEDAPAHPHWLPAKAIHTIFPTHHAHEIIGGGSNPADLVQKLSRPLRRETPGASQERQRMHYGRRTGYSTIMGYSNIMGADGGQATAQAQYRMHMRGAGVQLPLQGGGPSVGSTPPDTIREFPLGFFQAAVGKSSQVTVSEKPQVIFRGSRLVMASQIESTPIPNPFRLNDLKVGQRSQFVSATQVPAVVFSEQGVGVALSLDTCSTGQDISIVTTNSDAAATHNFEAALIGTAALPG